MYQIHTILPEIHSKWEGLPFEQRMRFVGALTRKVILSHPSPSWLHIEIQWKLPEWGTDSRYIKRSTSNGSPWSEEEDQTLRALYPATDALDVLNAFPERTWFALRRRAEKLGIRRCIEDDLPTRSIYAHQCIKDVAFLQKEWGEAEQGGKGHGMRPSDIYGAWIGSCDSAGSQRDCKLSLLHSVYPGLQQARCV